MSHMNCQGRQHSIEIGTVSNPRCDPMKGKRWPEVLHSGLVLRSPVTGNAGYLAKFAELYSERCGDKSIPIVLINRRSRLI
jgi:hypothetical protein